MVPPDLPYLYCMNFGKLILRKITKIAATRCHMSYFKAKMHQILCWLGLCPTGGAYGTPPYPQLDIRGLTSKETEGRVRLGVGNVKGEGRVG